MIELAKEYRVRLPEWIEDELAGLPAVVPDVEDRMRLLHRLAGRNWRQGNGGPFAALVAERDTGRIVSIGVNVVLASGVSSAHAEVVALGLAQAGIGGWDLGGAGLPAHELVGIEVLRDVLRHEALDVFRAYRKAVDSDGLVVYNARAGAR